MTILMLKTEILMHNESLGTELYLKDFRKGFRAPWS